MSTRASKPWVNGLLVMAVSLSTLVAYAAPPLPPPPDNAALLYYQVFLSLKLPDGDNDTAWRMITDYALGRIPSTSTIRSSIESLAIPKTYAIRAADLPQCDWGTDLSQGIDAILPYLGPLRKVARLLVADAQLSAEAGDFHTAVERCLTTYRMSRHANNGGTVINFLVANAMGDMAHQCLRRVLVKMPKDAATLDRIKDRLRQVQTDRIPLTTLMEYDFHGVWTGLTLKKVSAGLLVDLKDEKMKNRVFAHLGAADETEFIARNKAVAEGHLKRQTAVIESDQPYAQKFAAVNELNDQLCRDAKTREDATLASLILPLYSKLLTYTVTDHAAFNALETAIDLYRIQLDTGRLPDTLPDRAPNDPFSGKPFLYEKKGRHFTLRCRVKDLVKNETVVFEF